MKSDEYKITETTQQSELALKGQTINTQSRSGQSFSQASQSPAKHQGGFDNTARFSGSSQLSQSPAKHGLVMEGGSMRGMFTCGVTDVFLEEHIDFDCAVGTSAGATFGINFKSRQKGRAYRYTTRYCRDYRYGSILSLLKSGDVFDVKFCYRDIPNKLDPWDATAFQANPLEFYVVASDIETGRPVYYRLEKGQEEDLRWIQASASMPLFSNIVKIDNRRFLDGGVTDSIALKFMERLGCKKNVVILTQPEGYVRKDSPLLPLIRIKYRKYPALIRACEQRARIYNNTLRYISSQEKAGNAFVIRPQTSLNVGRLESNPKKLEKAYDMGRIAARKSLCAIRNGGFSN